MTAHTLLSHHRGWIRWGCAAACAALMVAPAAAHASKYDSELAPATPRPYVVASAASPQQTAQTAKPQRSGRSGGSAPAWLQGSGSKSHRH